MIIRRQLHPQNKLTMKKLHDNGMELKPIYKKAAQTNATSTGTSSVRDVDDLLKPIVIPKHNEEANGQHNYSSKERTERNLWRNDEVMEMLYTMQQVKALEKLNDKTVKSEHVFKEVEVIMHRNGFVKKSHVQIWTKWKFLKSTYMTSRRNGVIPRIVPPQIYEMIHQMIVALNQSLGDSCSSIDGDSSSASGMVISGVEGGVTNENDDDDSFNMAHPIFGYRLGMIKPEPVDTGYEPVNNKDSKKNALQDVLPTAKSGKEVKDEQNLKEANSVKETPCVQKIIEIPHRGRGRPPKNPPAAASTPNKTASPATMPPLRVAPFANAILTSSNDIAANRPPPPLTMPPVPRIRVANLESLKNGEPTKFVQPKLIPKPSHQRNSPPIQSAHNRSSSTPSPSYPKMKQIPMRKTPYSLRPDRAIPDLDASLSPPPPSVHEKIANKKLEEVPSTKHLIMHSNSTNHFQNMDGRKRRTDWQEPIPAPSKQPKYKNTVEEEKTNSRTYNVEYDKNYGKVLQNVIIDLSSSLRKMQTDMMRDFFNKQNELLEREHKFQMQQDLMVMKAFQEQTQEIMHSVNQLVGSMKPYESYHQQICSDTNCREAKPKIRRRMRQKYTQEQEDEIEGGNQLENNNTNNEENEVENEEQSQEKEQNNEMDHESNDGYTDDEKQEQDDLEDTDESERGEMEDNANEEENGINDDQDNSQLNEELNENSLTAEENDDDDSSSSSLDDDQSPIQMVSNELN